MAMPGPINLSVIIVTRNTCDLVCAAVRSVFESRDSLSKEVVVVDNGSSDRTAERLAAELPGAKCLRSEKNLGFAGANNLGARGAEGEFLLLLNSDARLKPESLALAVEWMRRHAECGVAGAQLLNPDGSRQNSIANAPTLATELLNKSLLRRLFPRRYPGKEHACAEPLEVESVVGAFMLVRASVWKELGGLDERYFFFLEETDFCAQARRRGWKVFHLPQVQVWHEQGKSAGQFGAAARVEYWRSRYLYFRKNSNCGVRMALRAGLSLRLAADWLASALLSGLTFGRSTRWRNRHRLNTTLWRWHLRGQPLEMGLPRA
jgi:GT2 family glycosyltransferase